MQKETGGAEGTTISAEKLHMLACRGHRVGNRARRKFKLGFASIEQYAGSSF